MATYKKSQKRLDTSIVLKMKDGLTDEQIAEKFDISIN